MQTTKTQQANERTQPQFTPGPWAQDIIESAEIIDAEGVNSGRKNDHRISQATVYVNHGSGKGSQICALPHDPDDGLDLHDPEYIANAKLIAAAPDLLEAVKELSAKLRDYRRRIGDRVKVSNDTTNGCSYALKVADAAIAKAID